MTNFSDIIGKLFSRKLGENEVVLNEVIVRSSSYQKKFQVWKEDHSKEIYSIISRSYENKLLEQLHEGLNVHILETKYSNGFAISFDEKEISKENFSFLFDDLAEKVRAMPEYKRVNFDRLITERKTFVETKEKQYLKPVNINNDKVIDQQYGNILIEHILVDDKPSYIKFIVNVYSDSNYKVAKSFNLLMEILMKK